MQKYVYVYACICIYVCVQVCPPHNTQTQVLERLPWFFSYTSVAGSINTKARGPLAVPLYMESLSAGKTNNTLSFEDLHIAHIYAFMLDSSQNEAIAGYTAHLMKGVATGSKRRKATAASSRAAPPNDKKQAKK